MYFPVSGVEVSPFIPVGVAFVISFFCSMGGLSGAFLLLPFQMSVLGFVSPAVSPTNHIFNVLSVPGGVWRFIRDGRMVWPLTAVAVAGTVPGTLVGSMLRVVYLPEPGLFKLFAAAVLLYIGSSLAFHMLKDMLTKRLATTEQDREKLEERVEKTLSEDGGEALFSVRMQEFTLKRIQYAFMGQSYSAPTKGVFFLCFIVGIIGGAYGIGGGAILAPFFVSVFRLPIYTIAGTTLFSNFLTSLSGLLFFLFLAQMYPEEPISPDWLLGFFFGLGGLAGIYCGARAQRHIPEAYIKVLLVTVLCGTAIKYALEAL